MTPFSQSFAAIKDQIHSDQAPRVCDNQNDVVAALKGEQVDSVMVDLPTVTYMTAAQVPNSVIVGQLPSPDGTKQRVGLVMAKNSPVTACVNAAVTALNTDGTLTSRKDTWLAKDAGVTVLQ